MFVELMKDLWIIFILIVGFLNWLILRKSLDEIEEFYSKESELKRGFRIAGFVVYFIGTFVFIAIV